MKTIKIIGNLLSVAILAWALQSCSEGKSEARVIPPPSAPIPVKVITPQKSAASGTIQASGQLTTEDETTLAFKIGGIVSAVYVKEGNAVSKGQLLAKLDQTEIDASVAQARYGFEKAERDHQRTENLYRDSVATLEQLQNAKTALDVARELLASATFNKRYAEVHAPANGYVLTKYVNPGQVVSAGEPVLICNGASSGKWILKVSVSDKQWAALKVDAKATVHLDAFTQRTFQAHIVRKTETADPLTGTFGIELQLEPGDARLATGMFGTATIQMAESKDTWPVPYDAVLDASGREGFVFISKDGKVARKQPVAIESFNGTHINIAHGLEDAKYLIVSGSAYLTDESPINIIK